ncbi:hemolysin family protein [Lachnospiraceae bacterium LCP25S3_G4]
MFSTEIEDDDVAEEIISMVDEGHEQGLFVGSEGELIRNIFEYADKDAKDIMTHRKNIILLNGSENIEEALNFILSQVNSRFPVYVDEIDNIIGVLHLRDAMKCYFDEKLRNIPIKELKQYLRPASFIPETKSIDSLFRKMQSEKTHMVIVVDEYGQIAGLVTMEDIIEEIVGNIQDEYDDDEEFIVSQLDGTYLIKGLTELDDVEEVLQISFDKEECDTLNGFLIMQLEHIPSGNEECIISYKGYIFQVLEIENNMIQLVKVEKTVEEC